MLGNRSYSDTEWGSTDYCLLTRKESSGTLYITCLQNNSVDIFTRMFV